MVVDIKMCCGKELKVTSTNDFYFKKKFKSHYCMVGNFKVFILNTFKNITPLKIKLSEIKMCNYIANIVNA